MPQAPAPQTGAMNPALLPSKRLIRGAPLALTTVVTLVLTTALPAASAGGRELWLPPLESPLQVSGKYRPPPTPYASGHRGIDLPAVPGDAARAPVAGVVSFVGKVADRYVLSVRVNSRTIVSFEPLEQIGGGLAEGDTVVRGQAIGQVSEGGHCLAECLHLGVRVDDAYVNPLQYFYEQPVLLPW